MYFIWEFFINNLLLSSVILITVVYLLLTKNHDYWEIRNVKYVKPIPLFGTTMRTTLSLAPSHQVQQENYNYFEGLPYGGTWNFWKPKLMLRDPRLIEQIMIKDFSSFTDRETIVDTKTDPLANHLVNANGSNWRKLRTKLAPVFSSGKLKSMLPQIIDCSEELLKYIEQQTEAGETLEARNQMSGLTMDVIGSCAFGLNLQAIRDPESEFRKIGLSAFAPSKLLKFRTAIRSQFGFLLKIFGWRRMPKSTNDFFLNTVKNTVNYREEKNVQRNDFIQLMMEVRKEEEKEIKEGKSNELLMTDNVMAANALVFLLAGYETTATTLGYVLYELSVNEDIQEKVYNEIENVLKKYKGEICWETLSDMTYIEQVISETLRKYPTVTGIARQSTKLYKFPDNDLELPIGSVVNIPVYSLHHDPKYYPEPEKFIPERFSEENKHNLVKSTYLPFGNGPRICIGLRFALLEIKVALIKLIQKFKITLNPKTISPLKFSAKTVFLVPVGGIWLNFILRQNKTSEEVQAVV